MKEQMLQRTNIDTFEVAEWTPRMVDIELTSSSFPPTLGREGDIFMPEPGNGEGLNKPSLKPQKPFEAVKPQENVVSKQGAKPIAPQNNFLSEQVQLNAVKEALQNLSGDSGSKDKKEKEQAGQVSPQKMMEARRAWEKHYKGQTLIGDEKRTVEMLIQKGIKPASHTESESSGKINITAGSFEDREKARDAWDRYNQGKNIHSEQKRAQFALIAMGISPTDPQAKSALEQASDFLLKPEHQQLSKNPTEQEVSQYALQVGERLSDKLSTKDIDKAGGIQRRQKEERLTDYEAHGQIDTSGITNAVLREQLTRINEIGGAMGFDRLSPDFFLGQLAQIDGLSVPSDQQDQLPMARERVTRLMREQRGSQENERQRERTQRQDQVQEQEEEYLYRRTGQRRYTIEQILTNKDARNWAVNNLFAGVDSRPHVQFQQAFNPLTYGAYYESLMDSIRNASIGRTEGTGLREEDLTEDLRKELATDFQRYQAEIRVREPLHNVNSILYAPKVQAAPLFEFMQQFSSELGDVAHRMPGVRQMMDLYEEALREDMMKHNGELRPEAVLGKVETSDDGEVANVKVGEVEELTKKRFKERNNPEHQQIIVRTSNGEERKVTKKFEDWEVDRVFTISRGMMLMSQRLISLAAESRLPKEGQSRYTSLFLQDVIQGYSPYTHLLSKYGVGEKGLAAYLYKTDEGSSLLKKLSRYLVTPWSTNDLRKAAEEFTEKYNPFEALDTLENFRYLARLNPNRVGDMFTWLSWRVGKEAGMLSMTTDFLKKGSERMKRRLLGLPQEKYKKPQADAEGLYPPPAPVASGEDLLPAPVELKSTRPGTEEDSEEGKKYISEYYNWIGTAIRFEKLRGDLDKKNSSKITKTVVHDETTGESKVTKTIEKEEYHKAVGEAKIIIEEMVKLQPHRLYLVSKEIRERMKPVEKMTYKEQAKLKPGEENQRLTMEEFNNVSTILDNLSKVESAFLADREGILDRGETFNSAVRLLDEPDSEYWKVIQDNAQRNQAISFRSKLWQDYDVSKGQYYNEFIDRRETKHGFVLWTGDVPLDEFNISTLGPTGGFIRRAGDGGDQVKAAEAEIKLITNLHAIKTPEQLLQALKPVYDSLKSYDSGKAKQAFAEKLEGYGKFFAADWKTDIPLYGLGHKIFARTSMAQIAYGKGAPAWGSSELRSLVVQAHDGENISDDQFRDLKDKLFGGNYDVARDIAVTGAQLVAIALLIYILQKSMEKQRG